MKVYVDELPKDCLDCPCESEYYCNLLNEDVGCCKWGEIHKDCPLKSLADYTKQVRKEVCEEIIKKLKSKEKFHPEDDFEIDYDFYYKEDVEEVLDQLSGETNE